MPGSTNTLSIDGTGAVAAEAVGSAAVLDFLLMAPTTALDGDMQSFYIDPESVAQVTSTLLDKDGNAVALLGAPWDPSLGVFGRHGHTARRRWPQQRQLLQQPDFHHWHGRHHVQITSTAADTRSIPVAMYGSDQMSWYITGGAPSLHDLNGEPVGVPLQISRVARGQPLWYHLYTSD